jgi:hypothetical protein
MKNQRSFALAIFAALILACLQTAVIGQTANEKLANVTGGGSSLRWDVGVSNSGATVTVSAPDGRVFQKEFRAGASPEFTITDKQDGRLPDGTYSYELRLAPAFSPGFKEAAAKARGKDDDPEAERAARKHPALPDLVQSGSFSILNGAVIVAGAVEDGRRTAKVTEQPRLQGGPGAAVSKVRLHHPPLNAMLPDQVIPDDLIVQGSACVGLDCVNGEVFGFDTIRLKENNTRIQFDDTSAAGFPTNNWQIRANSSAAGGESFLGFVDQGATGNSETGTIVFQVTAGAPANSLKVSSNGKVGFRTATPVLDLHANTTDTPAIRLEQNNGGGFTAQTWDVASNEANFFVRDVTGGSRLPFRIRPGAPTSSIDISATGSVGIGTASPTANLDVLSTPQAVSRVRGGGGGIMEMSDSNGSADKKNYQIRSQGDIFKLTLLNDARNAFITDNILVAVSSGSVGIGTAAPDQKFSVNGDASKAGGGAWQTFSDERLKNIKGRFNSGLKAVMQLQPIRYEYRKDNALGIKSEGDHIGFGAQAVQKIIPEAVTKNSAGYLMVNNDPILWTMLNAIKEQQKEIAQLKEQVRQLRATSQRRRK